MRKMALLAALAACGSDHGAVDAPTTMYMDAPPPLHDAPPFVACTPVNGMKVDVRQIGQVQGGATLATSPPGDGRLFVIQQDGQIRIFENEQLKPAPFLDINQLVTADAPPGERGLLGLAFHPNYGNNNYFYVWYTTSNADVLERFTASDTDLNVADPNSGQIVLSIPDPYANHNGGMLEFGSDGYLYIGTGDGGSAGDPRRNGQALDRNNCAVAGCEPLLGKILRLDVDHPANGKMYGIPSTNPYAGGGGEPEILIRGVRNPWRWSFDRMTGDMWIADVGQANEEELDVVPASMINGSPGNAVNLGWSMYEGLNCYNGPCSATGMTFPLFQHDHSLGWDAIIGGQVYRGTCSPGLAGAYFFTDNGASVLARADYNPLGPSVSEVELARASGGNWPAGPSSIHADARGELYLTTTDGRVYHIEAVP